MTSPIGQKTIDDFAIVNPFVESEESTNETFQDSQIYDSEAFEILFKGDVLPDNFYEKVLTETNEEVSSTISSNTKTSQIQSDKSLASEESLETVSSSTKKTESSQKELTKKEEKEKIPGFIRFARNHDRLKEKLSPEEFESYNAKILKVDLDAKNGTEPSSKEEIILKKCQISTEEYNCFVFNNLKRELESSDREINQTLSENELDSYKAKLAEVSENWFKGTITSPQDVTKKLSEIAIETLSEAFGYNKIDKKEVLIKEEEKTVLVPKKRSLLQRIFHKKVPISDPYIR